VGGVYLDVDGGVSGTRPHLFVRQSYHLVPRLTQRLTDFSLAFTPVHLGSLYLQTWSNYMFSRLGVHLLSVGSSSFETRPPFETIDYLSVPEHDVAIGKFEVVVDDWV
jgi:hypothetical protein